MSVFAYKKFKIALNPDSKKVQGLKVGDIVRRQYFNGERTIYSLMCVLEIGTDSSGASYFIGALLEGDEPQSSELLDFVRVTSLFDTERSGALYLTASDSESPYMDIIDGIGKNESLSWPVGLQVDGNEDPLSQYIIEDQSLAITDYSESEDGHNRVLHFEKSENEGDVVLRQDFYKYVANPNRVLVSYKIKASSAQTATASLEYVDGVRVDGSLDVDVTTHWTYQLHAITVDWSGRHLRTFKLAFPELREAEEVWIADFNIILLSSVAQYGDASQIRIGKLDGLSDPVFGRLKGYGSYLQKMYSSGSAHVSGTLTAGDENGFGSTFYAGKIHRNVLLNSLSPNMAAAAKVDGVISPTGIGDVMKITTVSILTSQTKEWVESHVDREYTFSFWFYANNPCQLSLVQNRTAIGTIQIGSGKTHRWERHSVTFKVTSANASLQFKFTPVFTQEEGDAISSDSEIIEADTRVVYENSAFLCSPQLEAGRGATQYQATDAVLDYTEDYGAWFSRGGIGGTIQNPLLKLNFDGEGSIGTRTDSFLLKTDGSGYFAKMNIRWDEYGNVTFGENVTLDWDNFNDETKRRISGKTIKITGDNEMLVMHSNNGGDDIYAPSAITLGLLASNFELDDAAIKWQYKSGIQWTDILGSIDSTLDIAHDSELWGENDTIDIRVDVNIFGTHCYDTMTLKKRHTNGFRVEIESSQGTVFRNGNCSTTLTVKLYYQDQLVENMSGFRFLWHKYTLPDLENEDDDWYDDIDRTASSITLDYKLTSQDYFVVDVETVNAFSYTFAFNF